MSVPSPLDFSSPIALGTAGFGTGVPVDAAAQLLDRYVEAGGNHIDTAHDYASWVPGGNGASEKSIGQWLRSSGARKQVILATKVGCTQGGKKQIREEVLRRELSISLERLNVDSVDVLWLHRDDPIVPVDDILQWVEGLRSKKLFTVSGASNWSVDRLSEAHSRARELGVPGFAASQSGWNLASIDPNHFPTGDAHFIDADDEAWHAKNNFPLVAWEAQAGGFFSGRYKPDTKPASSRANTVTAHYANPANWRRLSIAMDIAHNYGVSPNQVALAWLRQQAFPVISIVGSRSTEQLSDSMASRTLTLTPEELLRLRNAN
jgi:aryl-alcohol dehydrogenase-like predicted oxidoreductase